MRIFDRSKVEVGSYSGGPIYNKTQDRVRLDISHVTFQKYGDSDWYNKQGFVVDLDIAGSKRDCWRFQFVVTEISKKELLEMTDKSLFELFLNEVKLTPDLISEIFLLGAREGRNYMRAQLKELLQEE